MPEVGDILHNLLVNIDHPGAFADEIVTAVAHSNIMRQSFNEEEQMQMERHK